MNKKASSVINPFLLSNQNLNVILRTISTLYDEPDISITGSLFAKYPFLLPILINAIILAIAILMTIVIIPETLKKYVEEQL